MKTDVSSGLPNVAPTQSLGVTETGASPWDHWGYRCPIDNLLVGGWEPWKIIPTDELSMIFRGWNYHQPDIFFFLTSPTAGSCSHLLRTVSKKTINPTINFQFLVASLVVSHEYPHVTYHFFMVKSPTFWPSRSAPEIVWKPQQFQMRRDGRAMPWSSCRSSPARCRWFVLGRHGNMVDETLKWWV